MSERAWWDAFALAWWVIGIVHAGELYTGRGSTENIVSTLCKFMNQKATLRRVQKAGERRNARLYAMEYMAKVEIDE
jgi:hypothetical protein